MFSNKGRRKKQKLKRKLEISQNKEKICVNGYLSDSNFNISGLLLISRETSEHIEIKNRKNGCEFDFQINLNDFYFTESEDPDTFDFYLKIDFQFGDLSIEEQERYIKKTTVLYDETKGTEAHIIRLGRFEKTETNLLNPLMAENLICQLYKTVKGSISLAVNSVVTQEVKNQIDILKTKKHSINLRGKIFTRSHEIERIDMNLISREGSDTLSFPVKINHLEKDTQEKFGLNRYVYVANISLNNTTNNPIINEDIYDAFFSVKFRNDDDVRLVRIGKPRFRARYNLKSFSFENNSHMFGINPYYTFRLSNLSFQVNKFETEVYKYLRKSMRFSTFVRLFNKRKHIWIVGERPEKAEDTGYHFFKYMRTYHPDKNVYYVIDRNSPNVENVIQYGNVLYFNSKEHIKAVLASERIIGSHHPDYLFPLRTKEFIKKVKGKRVFLQHGVMGTKNMVANYGSNSPGFDTDMFLVSSTMEREMIINDFGYDSRDVKVTGLSRFDSLFDQSILPKKQLLIIPTWREWLVRDDEFLESEYYERYRDLVFSKELKTLSEVFGFDIVFCLHPNMRRFANYFKDAPVRVIDQGEVDVQVLLKESAMMITDYSSVAFDFSFLKKPVVYYQFDRSRFIGKRGSHLDLDNDLPGDIVFEQDELTKLVREYVSEDFQMKDKFAKKASNFLKYNDQNSSQRIYNVIENEMRKKSIIEKILESDIYKALFRKFRKSKLYFPTMKVFYNIARKVIPVDSNLILFESGLGKQYSDSPRSIYEEIVRQNLNYKKVWVSNQRIRFDDVENTKRIKRLSPSYYYYLARSKYWVNNQNFPTYIKKRKETSYVQTWHGTPLKKMLFDIDNIMGRTPGYLDRVSSAIENWDYLLSPSSYASKAFKSAFQYKGEIIEEGYPRNDVFYETGNNQLLQSIKSRLNISRNDKRKIILYAPTFRDNQTMKNNKFTFDIEMDFKKMKEELGEEYILLLRMHVVIKNKIKLDEELQDFVIDVSSYSDMQELLLATDILITDYSSSMFDFANTCKPMVFFTYDLEVYKNDVRGFYINFEQEAPGPLVRTTNEIIECIQNIEDVQNDYSTKYKQFHDKYCSKEDGNAAKRVVKRLFHKK